MSKQLIIKALKGLGLSRVDVKVYIFLASRGPHKAEEIEIALNLHDEKIHRSLKDLQGLSIVKASIHHPLEFDAIPFEDVIDLFIEVKKEQAKNIQENKNELLSNWLTVMKKNSTK